MSYCAAHSARPLGPTRLGRARVATACAVALLAFSVPSQPKERQSRLAPLASELAPLPGQTRLIAGLEVGLAGPPVVGSDGGWWLLGRDGEVERFRSDDSLSWSISIGASITAAAATDERGQLLYIPTARDHVVAVDTTARVHWRFRAPAGIVGPLAWVPQQGLVFVGRDHALYWLDHRANIVLRAPLQARVSAGPTPFGEKVLVGTEQGQLLSFTRQGQRQTADLPGSAKAIAVAGDHALVLASETAAWLDKKLHVIWSRANVLGIGVTASRGREGRPATPVTLSVVGEATWLDSRGQPARRTARKLSPMREFSPLMVATESSVWAADVMGSLWEAHSGGSWTEVKLAQSGLCGPVLEAVHSRLLVGSDRGSVWSRAIDLAPLNVPKATSLR